MREKIKRQWKGIGRKEKGRRGGKRKKKWKIGKGESKGKGNVEKKGKKEKE